MREVFIGKDTRDPRYRDGQRNAIKWAITKLHRLAGAMNDWRATAVLNSAAFSIGVDWKYYPDDIQSAIGGEVADTGIKAQFGIIRASYEPLSGYVILSTSDGQIVRLEKDEALQMELAMTWIAEQRKKYGSKP